MRDELALVLGMAAVTIVPRILPAFLGGRWTPPKRIRQWLDAVPYAALGALILPGIVTSDMAHWRAGAVAGIVATIVALFRVPAFVTGFASVAAALAIRLIG